MGSFVERMRGMKGCTYTWYLRWKKLCPLALSLELETSNEEKDRDTDGVKPLSTRLAKELGNLIGGKDSLEKEVAKQTLE